VAFKKSLFHETYTEVIALTFYSRDFLERVVPNALKYIRKLILTMKLSMLLSFHRRFIF